MHRHKKYLSVPYPTFIVSTVCLYLRNRFLFYDIDTCLVAMMHLKIKIKVLQCSFMMLVLVLMIRLTVEAVQGSKHLSMIDDGVSRQLSSAHSYRNGEYTLQYVRARCVCIS